MKKLLIILLLFFFAESNAQLGLKVLQYRPTGELGFTLKKQISGELSWIDDFEDPIRVRYALQYVIGKPRMDTFPTTGTINNYVVPCDYVLHQFNILSISGGIDRWIWENKGKVLYGGLDVIAGAHSHDYYSDFPGVSTTNYSGSSVFGGIRLRIGFEAELNNEWRLFSEIQRSMFYTSEGMLFSYNDVGVGVRYLFY